MPYIKVVDQNTTYNEIVNQPSSYISVDNEVFLSGENLDFLVAENDDFLMVLDNETNYTGIGSQTSSYSKETLGSYILTEDGNRITTEDGNAIVVSSGGYYTKIIDV